MDTKYFLILFWNPGFYCKPCGEPVVCRCYESLSLIFCKEIEEFPRFKRSDIWNIDVVNSRLSQIPDLDDWPDLAMLNWIGNRYPDCIELEGWSSHIYVNSDCPRDSLSTIEINDGNKVFLWPFFLMIILFSLFGLAGVTR